MVILISKTEGKEVNMQIKDIMTKNVITISPDASLKKVGEILKEKRISGLPVVDEKGDIVGVVTITDMLRFILDNIYQWEVLKKDIADLRLSEMYEQERLKAKVCDIMTRKVITLNEEDTIEKVMKLMFEKKIHTLPVVKDGKLVGVVGKRDLSSVVF